MYHVAALGIVFNKETQVQKFYDQHTDDILCLCLHPKSNFVATGQVSTFQSYFIAFVIVFIETPINFAKSKIFGTKFTMPNRKLFAKGTRP